MSCSKLLCFIRAKVIKHNDKLKKRANDAKLSKALTEPVNPKDKKKAKKGDTAATSSSSSNSNLNSAAKASLEDQREEDGEVMQDQGFSRPRVLILCPFRCSAVQIIQNIQAILGENTSISGMEKLEEEYGPPDENDDEDATDFMIQAHKQKGKSNKKGPAPKPEDWNALFKQNIDDDFKVGAAWYMYYRL